MSSTRKVVTTILVASIGVTLLVAALAADQRWLDRHATSVFRAAPAADRIRVAAQDQRRELLEHLRSVTSPDGWFLPTQTEKAQTDAWTQWQTAAALLESPEAGPDEVRRCLSTYPRLFEPNGVCEPFVPGYGWPNFHDGDAPQILGPDTLPLDGHGARDRGEGKEWNRMKERTGEMNCLLYRAGFSDDPDEGRQN